jgi:hypothetical protein
VTISGAQIPKEVLVQIGVTSVLTTLTVAVSSYLGNFVSMQIKKITQRLNNSTVSVDKNPISKLQAVFRDKRPKIIVRRVLRGNKVTAMIERFNSDGTNFLLRPINLCEKTDKIIGLLEIMKAQDPHFSKNLDIRIDKNLQPYFDEEEISLWLEYFTAHEKLFSGVQ